MVNCDAMAAQFAMDTLPGRNNNSQYQHLFQQYFSANLALQSKIQEVNKQTAEMQSEIDKL